MAQPYLSRFFLFLILVFILYGCFLVFQPFLIEILVAAMLVSMFFPYYEKLTKKLKGRKHFASAIMCLIVALFIIIPLANIIGFAAQKSVDGYDRIATMSSRINLDNIDGNTILDRFNVLGLNREIFRDAIVELAKKTNDWIVGGAAALVKGTTSFIISLMLIIFTMFFFFVDGKKMLEKMMHLTPLPNKYDKKIFMKFRDVSYSTFVSTFVTAVAQGLIGAIGFMLVGLPAFLPGIAMAFLSLLPYIGAAFVWLPASIYLVVIGKVWAAAFLVLWGLTAIGLTDNLIRAYIIKGKAQVHPVFVIFSILGGITLFGFWGVIFGPIIISLAVTILHIYELEYGHVLDREQ